MKHSSHEDMIFICIRMVYFVQVQEMILGWEKVKSLKSSGPLIDRVQRILDDLFYGFHMIHKSMQLDFTDDVAMMLLKSVTSMSTLEVIFLFFEQNDTLILGGHEILCL